MKTCYLTTMIGVSLFFCTNGLQAQTTQAKLNQVELIKQFIGSWKCDYAKDTLLFVDYKPYGTSLEGFKKFVTNGKIVEESKRLCGYDKDLDKYIIAEVGKEEGGWIMAYWFTSSNKGVGVKYSDISNPDRASWKFEAEFKSPDIFLNTYLINNKPVATITYTRVK